MWSMKRLPIRTHLGALAVLAIFTPVSAAAADQVPRAIEVRLGRADRSVGLGVKHLRLGLKDSSLSRSKRAFERSLRYFERALDQVNDAARRLAKAKATSQQVESLSVQARDGAVNVSLHLGNLHLVRGSYTTAFKVGQRALLWKPDDERVKEFVARVTIAAAEATSFRSFRGRLR